MPAQQNRLSSPIVVSSRVSSPYAISVSSSTSPARESDGLPLSQAAYWPPMAANHRTVTQEPNLGSRAPSIIPAHASRASLSSLSFPVELENAQLREQNAELQSENNQLKMELETLK